MKLDSWIRRCSTWLLLTIAAIALVAGCAHNPPAPLPQGALNTFDADSFRVITDAHAALQSIRDDAAQGKIVLNGEQRALINQIILDDSTANHLYATYHASGSGDKAALSKAIQALIADLASLSTTFPKTPTAAATPQ